MDIKTLTIGAATLLAATLVATSCSSGGTTDTMSDAAGIEAADPGDPASAAAIDGTGDVGPPQDLSQADQDGLAFMREEEKLAGDVYRAMYDAWGLPIFSNIAAAEQTHTTAVASLLERYQLVDPAEGLAPGEFSNPDLQTLYDDLIAVGNQSATDALEVGALIEELDITDLRLRASDQADIDEVYATLERGSNNHLRAFNRQLERRGISYTPVHLDQDSYSQIVDSSTERGRQGR